MPKTSIYLPHQLAQDIRDYGISISEVGQAALRKAVADARDKESLRREMTEICVQTGPEPVVTEVFHGRWLVDPTADHHNRSSEPGRDRNAIWGIALTQRGRIAVYTSHRDPAAPAQLAVYDSLEEASQGLPSNIIHYAAAALQQQRMIIRDI